MPDWSYRTILRPLLFAMPPRVARQLSLGLMGRLGRSLAGPYLIDFLGHMRAPSALQREHVGLTFPSMVGIGCGLDPEALATSALARFGAGFVEIGPVTMRPVEGAGTVDRSDERQAIVLSDPPESPGLAAIVDRLASAPRAAVPVIVRLAVPQGLGGERATDECREMIELLAPHADAVSLATFGVFAGNDSAWREHLRGVLAAAAGSSPRCAVIVCVPADLEPAELDCLSTAALAEGVHGLLIDGARRVSPARLEIGLPGRESTLRAVKRVRESSGSGALLIASGGVHEPDDALQLLEAGADLVQVDSGLVFSGPGLPKRINDAVLFATTAVGRPEPPPGGPRAVEQAWVWMLLMGIGMLFGSLLALAIAMTRVVLPYDEQFAGLSRDQLAAVNARLLAFMTHDRVALAGTMISIGVLYTGLSFFGIRRGLHWAQVAVVASAITGFVGFFLFLGFGYFDPFHAFVTGILFQFLLLGLHGRPGEAHGMAPPCLRDDWRWRRGQWGQLFLVMQGTALCAAGLVISGVGVTTVFVPEDLEFMQTTRDALAAASRHLVPLVAHDRATFGAMLLSSGIAFLMSSLWGFRRGSKWFWWTMLLAGIPGYAAGIGVHYAVGYHNLFHLAPAFAGLALFLAGVVTAYPFLCARDDAHEKTWRAHRERFARQTEGR